MKQQVIAAVAGITLASLAIAGTFASQDMNLLEDPTETPTEVVATDTPSSATETPTPDGTETAVPTATETQVDPTGTPEDTTATPTPEGTATPVDATPTVEPTGTPVDATPTVEPSATPGEDADDVHGIPDSNPSKHPEDGDGVCEKGETVVKTTPSGNKVTVPCQAGGDTDEGGAEGAEEGPAPKGKGKGKNRG